MSTNVFIWNIVWTILFVSAACDNVTHNVSDESITTTTAPLTPPPTTTTNTTESSAEPVEEETEIPEYEYYYDQPARELVQCQCGSGEVFIDQTGQCQPQEDGTTVPMEIWQPGKSIKVEGSTGEFSVTVKDLPPCDYRQVNLTENEFWLRDHHRNGLLVIAGSLLGLRVEDYCVHHQKIGSQIKVTARGCISRPDIPKCCPLGKIRNDGGECITKTMGSFQPPLVTGSYGPDQSAGAAFPWSNERIVHVQNLSCPPHHAVERVKLGRHSSYLAVLPQFLLLSWHPEGKQIIYTKPSNFCVDAAAEDDDTYYTYSCQHDTEAACKNNTCINKCCPEGKAFSVDKSDCVLSEVPFKPDFPSPHEKLYRFPECTPYTNITKFQLKQDGKLEYNANDYTYDKFCMDTFIIGGSSEAGAMVCLQEFDTTPWHDIRRKLLPMCIAVSWVFLALLILLHAWIPELYEKEGRYQLFLTASLFLVYSVTFINQVLVPNGYVSIGGCMFLAFLVQFAFLSAFFWLNIICFDVCRHFRKLVKTRYNQVLPAAAWKYVLFGLGGPLAVTMITILVQYAAPKDGSIPWLVHPRIGEGRCWFRSDMELFLYFYVPIVVLLLLNFIFIGIAYYYLRIIHRDFDSPMDQSENIESFDVTKRKYDSIAMFWQRFYLLALMSGTWLTEILSFKIPPEELWAPTDILNNLQGVFVFIVFLSHHNIRDLLNEKVPELFKFRDSSINNFKSAQKSMNNASRNLSKKVSSSSLISNISAISKSSNKNKSPSSYNLNEDDQSIKCISISTYNLTEIE